MCVTNLPAKVLSEKCEVAVGTSMPVILSTPSSHLFAPHSQLFLKSSYVLCVLEMSA